MNLTLEKLKEARDAGIPDDVIWETAASAEPKFNELKQKNIPLDVAFEAYQQFKPQGTSFTKEIQQIGPAFMESLGRPLESMGETAEVFGFTDIAAGLKGAITEPDKYESAAARFTEPKEGDASFVGFAWQYAPRAIVEQTGQLIGSMASRAAGGLAGSPAGPAGIAAGAFVGPAVFEAAQIIGPVAKERAANNGREVPNQSDIAAAILTATGSGALNAIGARYLPGGEKATGKFFKRLATSFLGEAPTEAGQSLVEQVGGTAFTEKGLEVSPKQALAEGIIGGGSAAAITAISAPLYREPKEKKIVTEEEAEEQYIEGQSNIEAINLTAPAGDIQTKKDVSRIAELEKVKAENELLSQALEPNEPEAKRLDLENAAIDKEITRLQGGVIESAGLTPINQSERDAVAASKEETPTSIATRIEQTKVAMAGLEPTSRRYTELQDQLAADEGKLVEQQQVELAKKIAEEPPVAEAPAITPAPVEEAAPTVEAKQKPKKKLLTELEKLENKKQKLILSNASKEKLSEINSKIELERNKQIRELEAKSVAIEFAAELRDARQQEEERTQRQINASNWNKTIVDPKEWIAGYDIVRSDTDKLIQTITDGKVSPERSIELIDDALRKNAITQEYAEASKNRIRKEFNIPTPAVSETITPAPEVAQDIEAGAPPLSTENLYFENNLAQRAWRIAAGFKYDKERGDWFHPSYPKLSRGNAEQEITDTNPPTKAQVRSVLDQLRQKYTFGSEKAAPVETPTFEKGDIVRVPNRVPVYEKGEIAGGKTVMVGGSVTRVMPDGKVEVRLQQGGYATFPPAQIEMRKKATTPAVSETITEPAAAPAGPAVGNRIKLGRSPQTYVIEEVIPQSEAEKENGEQYYSVKNEKTGETQVVEAKDIKPVSKLKRGEAGGVLIPSREDFEDLGRRIYEKGMQFKAWADRMVAEFGDAVREFLGSVWETVSGIPAKINELAGYLPGKGEGGSVLTPMGGEQPKKGVVIEKRGEVAGAPIAQVIKTPKGINKITEASIKKNVFNSDEVDDTNTKNAWDLIGKLQQTNPESITTIEEVNKMVGDEWRKQLKKEDREDNVAEDVKVSIGGSKIRNELFKYAFKLNAQGNPAMLNYLLENPPRISTGGGGTESAQTLQALEGLKSWIIQSSEKEKAAFYEIAASRFFNTKTPTDEQIKQIKAMFDAVKKVKIDQEKELSAELEEVGKATGIDVAERVKKEVAKGAKAKAESEADILSKEYYSIQSQAEAQIERLAKIQSDTPSFAKGKRDEIKKIVNDDLKNTPDMGRKDAWKSMLTAKLKDAGVNETDASLLSELVWRQHEINDTNRKMDETVKAVEKGAIKGIVDAILNTPLSEQQKPEWRRDVIKKYLIDAGVASSKADNIAKLFDLSLQKRFAEAQVKAAERAMKGIGGKLTPESKRAFQAFIKAIRAQVVNPGTDAAKEFGKQMGWKGFTPEQIAKINEMDAIIESDTTTDAEKYVAIKKIQDIIASVSLPPTALSAFSSFYIGNALGRITTASIQVVDPALYAAFDTAVDAVRMAATNPAQVPFAIYNYFASLHRMMKEIAFSFRNDVNRSGKMVDYLDNNDAKITRVFQDGQRLWKQGQYKEGLKKMLFGYPTITFRTLKALDDGSFSLLREAAITRYVSAAMDMAKIPKKNQRGVIRGLMQGREMDIKQMINQGLSKTDATVYANDRMMKEITNTLSGLNIEPEDTINSIINDSLSRLGKTRFIEEIAGEGNEIKDVGTISWPFIKFYELTSRGVSNIKGPAGEAMRIFQRVLFGFPLIPARMFNIAAGYTPLTLYRHFLTGRYPLTYGTAMQRKQRLIEQMSGVIALAPFLLLRSMSLDDEEKKGVRVYFTGQGPLKSLDKTLHQQWNRKHKPFSMEVFIGDKKIALDAKASGPFSVLIYTMGAIDDWQIRNRIKNKKIEEGDWRAVEEKLNFTTALYELSGYALLTYSRRGPTTAVMQGAVDFRRYPDDPLASIGSELSFSAIPAVPVLGMGVVKNISDLLSEPIDTTTIKGALLNNIPIVGPLATKPAINTFGQKVGELQVSEKLKKATGIPFTLTDYSNPDDQKIANITMKYGDGPEPIKRSWLEDQFESMITDEEWYAGAEAFGKANRQMVLEDYDYLNDLTNEEYRDEMESITKAAREDAYDAIEKMRKKNP